MNGNLAVVPPLLALFGALISLFFPKSRFSLIRFAGFYLFIELIASLMIAVHTFQEGFLVTAIGGWQAPYGITLVIDYLSSIMLVAVNTVFFTATLFYLMKSGITKESGTALALIFFMQTGATLSLVTGDFFNLFVAYEILFISSYVLFASTTKKEDAKQVYHYLIIGITGSGLFLTTIALIYGLAKNLNMAALSLQFRGMENNPSLILIALFVLLIFGLKGGIFPLYFWLPNSYSALPSSLAALFSAILTKVSIYALVRMLFTVFPHNITYVTETLLVLSGFTMLLGVIGAISRSSMNEILCYHILSQVGYIFMGIGFFTATAISAALFFTIHNIIVKSSLLLICEILLLKYGTLKLKSLGSVSLSFPVIAFFFILQALSLAGLPPLSGFWGKYIFLIEGIKLERYLLVFLATATSFFTLYSMIKIWSGAFVGPLVTEPCTEKVSIRATTSLIAFLVVITLFMGLGAELFINLTEKAATQLFSKDDYIKAVLGGG